MTIYNRQTWINLEREILAPYAVKSKDTRGRTHDEPPDLIRTPFQKDRDRVIHSRAFRRLSGKTQVFVAHYGDHYRKRMTHSLEVAQVSRDVARALGLNEDLSETIALAHDLGHTPFGHAGQDILDKLLHPFGLSFEHNQQSQRIVEVLESVYPDFPGLNLSFEVIQGLKKHQSPWDQAEADFKETSLEAQLVNLADEVAYNNHDVDDGLRSGLISEKELSDLMIWQRASAMVQERYGKLSDDTVRQARTVSAMVGMMIDDLIRNASRRILDSGVQSLDEVYRHEKKLIEFSREQYRMNHALKDFLKEKMYFHPDVVALSERGQRIIQGLFETYCSDHSRLPDEDQQKIQGGVQAERVVADYIAGMTDSFAEEEWNALS